MTEEVEVATTPPPTFEAKEEEMFLSFLEEFENIPKKPMHADDMAIMALMGPVSPGTTTSVPEQIEATVAPTLDHDDESLFLSFLEDHENLQTTTVQAETSAEAVEEDDVFGVEIIEDSSIEGVKSESLPDEEEDADGSDEYPELVTDYFDLSDSDERNSEEEETEELEEPIAVDDSVSDDDLGDTDSKERPGKDSLVKLILNLT